MKRARSQPALLGAIGIFSALALWFGLSVRRAQRPVTREAELTHAPSASGLAADGDQVALATPSAEVGAQALIDPARQPPIAGEILGGVVRATIEGSAEPAAGADVYWFGPEAFADPRWRAEFDQLGMGREFFERNGRRFVTDADGVASVPVSSARIQIIATTETHFGMTTCDGGNSAERPVELQLRAAFGVDVRVRSPATGSAVRDVLVIASNSVIAGSRIGAHTDERGIARLWPLFHEESPRGRWYAAVPGVFLDEPRVPLSLEARTEPLELELPESAPAEVRIVDRVGALRPLTGTLTLVWNDREGDPVPPRQVRIEGGIADVTRLEVGVGLRVQGKFPRVDELPTAEFRLDAASNARAVFKLALESTGEPARH